ncbi:hypothetical protein H0X32_02995 [Patescibacteria group bacterium]|nr:hypothetical protein [Patescibacteria group bacterium]
MESTLGGIIAFSESVGRAETKADLENEEEFLAQKIQYEIGRAHQIDFPKLNESGTEIDLVSDTNTLIAIGFFDNSLSIARGTNSPIPFSSTFVKVTNGYFTYLENNVSSSSSSLHAEFDLSEKTVRGETVSEHFRVISFLP